MKIVVIGGTRPIGPHNAPPSPPSGPQTPSPPPPTPRQPPTPQSGINTITGEGLSQAMAGTHVVIDLANSPSFEDKAVLEFFETSGRNLLAAEAAAGSIRLHVALSIVGIDRSDNGYFRAKVAQ